MVKGERPVSRARKERGDFACLYRAYVDAPEFDALNLEEASVLTHGLILSPENNRPGFFQVFPEAVAHRAKVDVARVEPVLARLEADRWILREGRWLWIRNAIRYDPFYHPANPNQVLGLVRFLGTLPRCALLASLIRYYQRTIEPETKAPFLPPPARLREIAAWTMKLPPPVQDLWIPEEKATGKATGNGHDPAGAAAFSTGEPALAVTDGGGIDTGSGCDDGTSDEDPIPQPIPPGIPNPMSVSVSSSNDPSPHPLPASGAGERAARALDQEEAQRRAQAQRRVSQARDYLIARDGPGSATRKVMRKLREWANGGATLARMQEGIDQGLHLPRRRIRL